MRTFQHYVHACVKTYYSGIFSYDVVSGLTSAGLFPEQQLTLDNLKACKSNPNMKSAEKQVEEIRLWRIRICKCYSFLRQPLGLTKESDFTDAPMTAGDISCVLKITVVERNNCWCFRCGQPLSLSLR